MGGRDGVAGVGVRHREAEVLVPEVVDVDVNPLQVAGWGSAVPTREGLPAVEHPAVVERDHLALPKPEFDELVAGLDRGVERAVRLKTSIKRR